MIKDIVSNAIKNFQALLVAWVLIILVNQIFIFGACFAPYCLIAALPHTFVIALLINQFLLSGDAKDCKQADASDKTDKCHYVAPKVDIQDDDFEEAQPPYCPHCGSKMLLRSAKKGIHAGNKFWGCSSFPHCKGILNL